MPNITYIKFIRNFFNATNGQLPFAAIHTNVSNAYPDNVILLIEEHNTETNDDDDDAYDGFHLRSTTSVTLMIMAWVFMIIGFTLCWCFQLFEKQKTQMQVRTQTRSGSGNDWEENGYGISASANRNQPSGTQALESSGGNGNGQRGCFVLDGDLNDNEMETDGGDRDLDRTSDTLNPGDIIRRYDMDVESLPSYTIVSGLPTYDDALEEFRKAGLILKPPIPVIKIFDSDTKDLPPGDGLPEYTPPENTCVCGAGTGQIIELNPEHLKILSQKRLSLQISFNALPNNIRRNSRPRVDLCQQVGRNNLLRAQRDRELLTPEIHRSSSMTLNDERNMIEHRLRKLEQHRGSIS